MKETIGLLNNTIRLRSGAYFDLLDPNPEQFTTKDIAGALAKLCRFGGQIGEFYSVAEHSVVCLGVAMRDGLGDDALKAVLLHDAAEAFIGDCVRPLKVLLSKYGEIESRIEAVIGQKYGVNFLKFKDVIREIDNAVLFAERRTMFTKDDQKWHGEDTVRILDIDFNCWLPEIAEIVFKKKLEMLGIAS